MASESLSASPPPPEELPPRPGWGTYLLFAAASGWIILATLPLHLAAWFVDQVLFLSADEALPGWGWLLIAWGHGLLLALPVAPLALLTRAPRFRAAYQAWLLAVIAVFPFGLVRLFPVMWSQAAALAQMGLGLALGIGALILARARGRAIGLQVGAALPALALAPVVVLPSLVWGALGSPADALLHLLAGLSLGLFAGVALGAFLMQPLASHSSGPGWDVAFGGFAAGVALLILGAGFGFGGVQLLLLIALPPLGLAAAGLSRFAAPRSAWLPIAAFVGLAAAAPAMLVDPEEMSLILGGDEILAWALRAAGLSLVLGWAAGLGLWALRRRIGGPPRTARALGWVAATWAGGLLLYFFAGHPGFYGERLFVVLREQADVTPAYAIADRAERLRHVYAALTAHADTTQAGLRATLDRLGVDYQPYYLVNALEVDAGPILRVYLSLQPEVDRVLDSQRLRPLPAPPPPGTGGASAPAEPQWNLTSIGADRVWRELGVAGEGIVVGQSDSGVQGDHPALRAGYRGRGGSHDYHWLDPWNGTRAPADSGGHGTHTLGLILGRGNIGVAPGADWFGCVNLARNLANPALYLDCLQFMLAPYPQGGDPFRDGDPARAAHVLNNSWGCPRIEGCDATALAPATSALRAAGIFVVASAGNNGPRCGSVRHPLALYADVFSVGAVDQFGDVAEFSSRGPVTADGSQRIKPDILAPGVGVLSAMPGGTYGVNSGTSMAGPHVVGVVALMWSANPALIGDVDRTAQILIETARPYRGATQCAASGVPDNDAGYGLVDAYAAVQMASEEK